MKKLIINLLLLTSIISLADVDEKEITLYRSQFGGVSYEYKADSRDIKEIDFKEENVILPQEFSKLLSVKDPLYQVQSITLSRFNASKIWLVTVDSFKIKNDGVDYRDMKKEVYLYPQMKKLKKVVVEKLRKPKKNDATLPALPNRIDNTQP